MERLNYQHLFYFWNAARYGSITRASEKLKVSQPTISSQLATFEKRIGAQLFFKDGRRLTLTDVGRRIFNYSEQIFQLGEELSISLQDATATRQTRITVGVVNSLPKLVVYRLVNPVLSVNEPLQLTCYEDKKERLLAELALNSVDLVLSDAPATTANGSRVFNHLISESDTSVYALPELAAKYQPNFPKSLNDAPMLLPTTNIELRRSLDEWFEDHKLRPLVKAEIEDSALLKTFASEGVGLIVAPTMVAPGIKRQYGLAPIGKIQGVTEQFYAITTQRKARNPAVSAILSQISAPAEALC